MHRRAQAFLICLAAIMGVLAAWAAWSVDRHIVDPDGFLGPSYLRLPGMLMGAFLIDLVPLAVLKSVRGGGSVVDVARARVRSHWRGERIRLVVIGTIAFYITYVSYRNLKSYLPLVVGTERKFDRPLHQMDLWLFFGHNPALALHSLLGTNIAAHLLSTIYLWFLPAVPIMLTGWLIWSRKVSYGYWFVSAQVMAWGLGTASYYALPTLGPGFRYPWFYADLATTGTSRLMNSLFKGRKAVIHVDSLAAVVQSVAGFASLHCAITLLFVLMVRHTVKARWAQWVVWINFGLTIIATLYFGWHYIADDVAGILIALIAFRVGAWSAGEDFSWRRPNFEENDNRVVRQVDTP
jgi:hypothetical protein